MTIHLTGELERFVHDAVRAGNYAGEDEVIRDVLIRLKQASRDCTPDRSKLIGSHGQRPWI